MKKCARRLVLFTLVLGIFTQTSFGLVSVDSKGNWPQDWPAELEVLRKSSRTIDIATGIQQHIYEIPIPDQKTFDAIWPAVLKVRTNGSPLTLYRAGTKPPPAWGDLLSNREAAVRIYAPSFGGIVMKEVVEPPADFRKLVKEGRALQVGVDWPKDLFGKEGELPEFVTAEKRDGRLVWAADDSTREKAGERGFFNRARIEIELIVDGQAIDLNNVKFPSDARIVDRRFEK